MSVKATGPPRRGKRSPTAVWILSRRGKNGTSHRIRWIDPISGKSQSEACGRDKALARIKRDATKAELREGLSGQLPDSLLSDLASKIQIFMVGKSHHTIRETRRSLEDLVRLAVIGAWSTSIERWSWISGLGDGQQRLEANQVGPELRRRCRMAPNKPAVAMERNAAR